MLPDTVLTCLIRKDAVLLDVRNPVNCSTEEEGTTQSTPDEPQIVGCFLVPNLIILQSYDTTNTITPGSIRRVIQ